jgi:ADP-ribose pyrophosphatase YjhB (NUDIX family)
MRVDTAQLDDMPNWLALAAEVEPLFGPMVDDPGFTNALRANIQRGTACCVRENDGPPGTPLMGGRIDRRDIDHQAALRRELREEFAVEVDVLRYLNAYPYRQRLHYVYHVQPRSTAFVTDNDEVLDYAWLTADDVAAWHTGFELDAITTAQARSVEL